MSSHESQSASPHPVRRTLVAGLFRVLSWLPLSWNRQIGATIGRIAWATNSSLKNITLTNLALCRPDLSAAERKILGRASLLHTGQALTESAWVWLRSPNELFKRTRVVAGEDLFNQALASDQGVIIATPHIGNWEACNIVIARDRPMTYLYRAPRTTWLEPLIIRWRANFNALPARLDASGLRAVLQQLKSGQTIGVLPDQEPDAAGGVFAPLFGEPANSMTLLQKLGTRGKAQVLFCVCERKTGGLFKSRQAGWNISFLTPDPEVLNADPLIAVKAMNRTIERCIAINPEQYLWSYKRFSLLADGGRRNYKTPIQ